MSSYFVKKPTKQKVRMRIKGGYVEFPIDENEAPLSRIENFAEILADIIRHYPELRKRLEKIGMELTLE